MENHDSNQKKQRLSKEERKSFFRRIRIPLLTAAGVEVPSTYEGRDLVSLAQAPTEDRSVCGQFGKAGEGLYMIRDLRYKYIYSAPDGREWLFALTEGQSDCEDLSLALPEVTASMRARLIGHIRLRRGDGCAEIFEGDAFRAYPRLTVDAYDDGGLLFQDTEGSLPKDMRGYTD